SGYDKMTASITVSDTAIAITAGKADYNYTEFLLEPVGKAVDVADGMFVLANVYDTSNDEVPVTPTPHRMVFVANTPPAAKVHALKKGQRLHVLGIPRVNLAEADAIPPGHTLDVPMPYEIVVVAVFPD